MKTSDRDALEHLISQFSQPLAFLRELVQNSLDAGSETIEVTVDYDAPSKCCRVQVLDTGEGMDREIIDTKLTTLFSSTKENDLTKIGKFGIGFVSIYAIQPQLVVVETGRGGESWRILFKPDRSFERRQLDYPVEGTSVTVFLKRSKKKLAELTKNCRNTISFWCKHSDVEIRFNGDPLNEDFDLPSHPYRYRHLVEGTEAVVAPSTSKIGFHGYYNRGLTLLEGKGSPLPHVSFKLRSRYLEHTLTRDNVLHDKHYQKAMREVRKAADQGLPEDLFSKLAREDNPELWRAARIVSLYLKGRFRAVQHHQIFQSGERRLSLKELPQEIYFGSPNEKLWDIAAADGHTLIEAQAEDEKLLFLQEAGYQVAPLNQSFLRYRKASPNPNSEALLKTLKELCQGLVFGLRFFPFESSHYPSSWSNRVAFYLDPEQSLRSQSKLQKRRRDQIGLRQEHPVFKKSALLAGSEPELAAYLLFRRVQTELALERGWSDKVFGRASSSIRKQAQ